MRTDLDLKGFTKQKLSTEELGTLITDVIKVVLGDVGIPTDDIVLVTNEETDEIFILIGD